MQLPLIIKIALHFVFVHNASLKCPAGKGTSTWPAMKYSEAGMLELRTYPQGRFEVFVRRWV